MRLELGPISKGDIDDVLENIRHTTYKLGAKQYQAPEITDCITAVRYIIQELTGKTFPLTYIGDMPLDFLKQDFLSAKILPIEENNLGDLLFFHGKSRFHIPMIKHVGICTERGKYFHSLWRRSENGGGTITDISEKYGKIASKKEMLESKDPRSLKFNF